TGTVSGPRPPAAVTLSTPTCSPARNCSRSSTLMANDMKPPSGQRRPGPILAEPRPRGRRALRSPRTAPSTCAAGCGTRVRSAAWSGMRFQIEPMTLSDLADVLAEHDQFWGERDLRFLHQRVFVQEFGDTCLTAREADGRIAGYLIGFTTPRR